jgi:hypothetical protein
MMVFKRFHSLMAGMVPFSAEREVAGRDLLSVLAASHSTGTGVLGYLEPVELRQLAATNVGALRAVQDFPLGLDTGEYETPITRAGERSIVRWREMHPRAKFIKIRGNVTDQNLIDFLAVPDTSGRVAQIEGLDIKEGAFTDAVVPFLRGIKYLDIERCAFSTAALQALDVTRLEVLSAYDTNLDNAGVQRMNRLRVLKAGIVEDEPPVALIFNPDLSMLPLTHVYLFGAGLPRLPPSVTTLSLGDSELNVDLTRYLDLPRLGTLSLARITNLNVLPTFFPATLRELNLTFQNNLTAESFRGLVRLRSLKLFGTNSFGNEAFRDMVSLKELTLYGNGGALYDGGLLGPLVELQVLNLDGGLDFLEIVRPIRINFRRRV